MSKAKPVIVNGWTLYMHPLFARQVTDLIKSVEKLKENQPGNYKSKTSTKRLAAIYKLIFEVIPQDPSMPIYRQGKTLGQHHKHWFRAKFFQRYRLFFRFHQKAKIIIYVWVNDERHLRTYGDKNDVYRVFAKMLKSGNPPDGWDELLRAAENLCQL